jgi:hypothetical protein
LQDGKAMTFKQLKYENKRLTECLAVSNKTVLEQMKHIEMLNRQLDQQDHYLIRKDEENNLLKRMYRDDIINNYVEK